MWSSPTFFRINCFNEYTFIIIVDIIIIIIINLFQCGLRKAQYINK